MDEVEGLVGGPGEEAPGKDQRCEGSGGGFQKVAAGRVGEHGVLFRFRAFRSKAALNRLHRHGFRRRFGTTVPVGRLAGVVGGSYPSALRDEVETFELLPGLTRIATTN